jgi:hypothetical protein
MRFRLPAVIVATADLVTVAGPLDQLSRPQTQWSPKFVPAGNEGFKGNQSGSLLETAGKYDMNDTSRSCAIQAEQRREQREPSAGKRPPVKKD